MNAVDQATQTQINNIQSKTGQSLAELYALITASGFDKHGQIRDFLKQELGLGHGDANTLAHFWRNEGAGTAAPPPPADVLAEIYTGNKAELRPLHEQIMAAIDQLGEFELAPKKGYVSLRRKKQFAMVGPASKGRVEVGLNMKGIPATDRLVEQPAGGMCQYKVYLTDTAEVDDELLGWVRTAYEGAG